MTNDRWLTYADAGALLGVTPDSLRHRARREHWGKRLGNEGKALVLVPLDAPRYPGGDQGSDPEALRPSKRPTADTVAAYLAQIADLDGARAERDREREERQTERERADRITADLAEIARQFAAATTGAKSKESAVEAKLDAVRAEMAELRARPWWKMLRTALSG